MHLGSYRDDRATLGLVASAVIVGAIFALANARPEWNPLADLLAPILSFAMFVSAMSVVLVSNVSVRDRLSMVWFFFMLAVMFWFVQAVSWQFYTYSYLVTTDFSDVFGLAGYLPALVGLGLHLNPFKAELRTKKVIFALALVIACALVLFAWLYVTIPFTNTQAIALVVAYSYLILDFAVLALGIPLVILFSTGTFWKPFLFFASGIVLALLSQVLWVLAELSGATFLARPVDLVLDIAYLTAAWGFYLRIGQTAEVSSVSQ